MVEVVDVVVGLAVVVVVVIGSVSPHMVHIPPEKSCPHTILYLIVVLPRNSPIPLITILYVPISVADKSPFISYLYQPLLQNIQI